METAEEYALTEKEGYQAQPPAKVDTKTGEISTRFENDFDVSALLNTAGTINLTTEQKAILYAPVNEDDIEIRPDGLVYLPWMEYVSRLQRSFGLAWAIIPQGMPKFHKTSIYWGFWLVIQGKLAGYAMGEQAYHPTNATMTYSDAVEGAKSNALMRLCKGIGISLELWKPSFIRAWKEKYAESYWDDKKNKTLWRKKGNGKQDAAQPEQSPAVPAESNLPKQCSDAQRKKLWAMMKGEKELTDTEAKRFFEYYMTSHPKEVIEVDGKKGLTSRGAHDFIDQFEQAFEVFTKV